MERKYTAELRSIDPLATAKILAIFRAGVEIVFGIPAALVFMGENGLSPGEGLMSIFDRSTLYGVLFGPVIAAVGGYIMGILFGFAYNWAASHVGGIGIAIVRTSEGGEVDA